MLKRSISEKNTQHTEHGTQTMSRGFGLAASTSFKENTNEN